MVLPLAAFSAESAALSNATTLLALVGYLVEKVKEVRKFKKECLELTDTCIILSLAYLENDKELKDVRSAKDFEKCLQDVYQLVTQCRDWNILHVGWEVVVARKFDGLKKSLDDIQKTFNTELLIKASTSASTATITLLSLRSELSDLKMSLVEDNTDRVQLMDQMKALESELQLMRSDVRSLRPVEEPPFNVVSLPSWMVEVTSRRRVAGVDYLDRGLFQQIPVVFERVIHTNQAKIPRVVRLYQQMGEVALVQRLCAILDDKGQKYALMEDLNDCISTEEAVTRKQFSLLGRVEKIRFLYELTATVSTLHEAGILIKVISDQTVFLRKVTSGNLRPLLSNLSQARSVWEVSNLAPQDVRYESPEVSATRSKMSDIWSLGVLLLQLLQENFPFGITAQEVQDPLQSKAIRDRVHGGQLPFSSKSNDEQPTEIALIQDCLQKDPFLRPTASSLSQQLFELLVRVSSQNSPLNQPVEARTHFIGKLASKIISNAENKRSKNPKLAPEKLTNSIFDPLVQAAAESSDPSLAYVVGVAYLYDLVAIENPLPTQSGQMPTSILGAKRAIPYLERAQEQGHTGALKDLVRAYKKVTQHYHDLLSIPIE